jgi:hypothetical protein
MHCPNDINPVARCALIRVDCQLSFTNCFTAFLAMMAGMAVSFLIMTLELFVFKPHHQEENMSFDINFFEDALRYINTQNDIIDDLRKNLKNSMKEN